MRGKRTQLCALSMSLFAISCSGSGSSGDGAAGGDGGPGGGACVPGQTYCAGEDGDEVWECNGDGTGGFYVETCPDDLACSRGECLTPCEAAANDPSNVGCEFWGVDLDNEAFDTLGPGNDAAAAQYSIAVANENDYPVDVIVSKNTALFGMPVVEEVVTTVNVPANDMMRIDLPQREVDGSMAQNGPYNRNSGSGTFVSSHAYRLRSTGPVVAYQFNPIIQQFSNDASVLIPIQALGGHYYVIGWPTANPCGAPEGDPLHMESVPDHGAVTIVGAYPDTHVRVVPTHPVAASAGGSGVAVPATAAGEALEFDIGPYDVVNLESDQPQVDIFDCLNYLDRDGDFTGTLVTSNKPVAVFSSNERAIGTGGAEPPDPPGWDGDVCCTDHLEEQMLPTTALGWEFVINRSPVRSTDPGYREPDLYRLVGTVDGTVLNTSLPAPFDRLTVDAGKEVTFYAYDGFTAKAEGGAVVLGQVLLSQSYIPQGRIGDPTLIVFPAAEQHRAQYLFLVPPTFSKNYMVLSIPAGAQVTVDGLGLDLMADCQMAPIGPSQGTDYHQVTCPVSEGKHRVEADRPLGLTVYGYYSAGSYGYPGGSDVEIINPVD